MKRAIAKREGTWETVRGQARQLVAMRLLTRTPEGKRVFMKIAGPALKAKWAKSAAARGTRIATKKAIAKPQKTWKTLRAEEALWRAIRASTLTPEGRRVFREAAGDVYDAQLAKQKNA